jgi:hypothetical protein
MLPSDDKPLGNSVVTAFRALVAKTLLPQHGKNGEDDNGRKIASFPGRFLELCCSRLAIDELREPGRD